MRLNILCLIIAIIITIISLLLTIFINGFFLFPLFCILPMTYSLRDTSERRDQSEESNESNLRSKIKNYQNQQEKKILYCPNCRAEIIDENYNFCPICGYKFEK